METPAEVLLLDRMKSEKEAKEATGRTKWTGRVWPAEPATAILSRAEWIRTEEAALYKEA